MTKCFLWISLIFDQCFYILITTIKGGSEIYGKYERNLNDYWGRMRWTDDRTQRCLPSLGLQEAERLPHWENLEDTAGKHRGIHQGATSGGIANRSLVWVPSSFVFCCWLPLPARRMIQPRPAPTPSPRACHWNFFQYILSEHLEHSEQRCLKMQIKQSFSGLR